MHRLHSRWLRRTAIAVVAVVAATTAIVTAFTATYGSDTNTTERATGGRRAAVQVTLTDFDVTPGTLVVDRDTHVTLEVVNQGQEVHDLAVDGGPRTRLLAPGEAQRLDLGVVTGRRPTRCTVELHESLGMILEVQAV